MPNKTELVISNQTSIRTKPGDKCAIFKRQDASKALMIELLKLDRKNDIKHGVFKVNHNAHSLCSLYDLGAPPENLRVYYNKSKTYLEPSKKKKYDINESNLKDYLSKEDAYSSYLEFFDTKVSKLGIIGAFKKYLPMALPGVIGAALHPLIHLGYAIEFNNPIIASEALAFAYSDYWPGGELISKIHPKSGLKSLSGEFRDVNRNIYSESELGQTPPISYTAKLIYEELPKLGVKPVPKEDSSLYLDNLDLVVTNYEHEILELCSQWGCTEDTVDQYERDLSIGVAEIFGGSFKNGSFDFFLLHILTGLHGTRTLLTILDIPDQVRLLNLTFAVTVLMFLSQGGPIPSKYTYTIPGEIGTGSNDDESWSKIIAKAIQSYDAHLIKGVRNLYQLQEKYGELKDVFFRPAAQAVLVIPANGWTHNDNGRLNVEV